MTTALTHDDDPCTESGFSQMYKIANIGIIANFVLPYIFSSLLYLR